MTLLSREMCCFLKTFSALELNAWKEGRWLLRDVSIRVSSGDCVLLAGRNGSGKTTFLRSLAGVLLPSDGWQISGRFDAELTGEPSVRSMNGLRVSYLSQSLTPAEDLSVREFLLLCQSENPHSAWIDESFGIPELENQFLSRLSGGQWQRVRLAQCLRKQSDLFLLDEPDAFLDSHWRAVLMECLRGLREQSKIVIAVLHRPQEAFHVATHWLGLEAGAVMFFEPHREIFPSELMARLFLGKRLDSVGRVD